MYLSFGQEFATMQLIQTAMQQFCPISKPQTLALHLQDHTSPVWREKQVILTAFGAQHLYSRVSVPNECMGTCVLEFWPLAFLKISILNLSYGSK